MPLLPPCTAHGQSKPYYTAIHSGVPWFDDRGRIVSAHGANIVIEHGRYYLFGEAHSDTSNAFAGFNCYSSTDLRNWKFERTALPVQDSGRLGPDRVGERAKVLKCAKTGEYVMVMHTDNMRYKDPCIGYATSKNITGPYTFRGPIMFNGQPIRRWDMGTFQDADGSAYLMLHGGLLYKLSDDYRSISELVIDNKWRGAEAPAIFKKNGTYFWLASDLTGWERNDNFYYTSTALKGPWIARGYFAPKGTATWNSQTSFVLPIPGKADTTYVYMGDRWSSTRQASAATYVWQPLQVLDSTISLPEFQEAWKIDAKGKMLFMTQTGKKVIRPDDKQHFKYWGNWSQDTLTVRSASTSGDSLHVRFSGSQVCLYGLSRPDGGYALVKLYDNQGRVRFTTTIEMYCKYPISTPAFLSPVLPKGSYMLTLAVLGLHWGWKEKSGRVSGSKGNVISIERIVVTK